MAVAAVPVTAFKAARRIHPPIQRSAPHDVAAAPLLSCAAADGPALQRWMLSFAAGLVPISASLLALAFVQLQTQALAAGERLTESLAQIVEEQTSKSFQIVDQTLQLAANALMEQGHVGGLDAPAVTGLLRARMQQLPFVRSLVVIDGLGNVRYASDPGMVGVNLADRPYFQVYRAQPQTTLYIGIPQRDRASGQWSIGVTRPCHPEQAWRAALFWLRWTRATSTNSGAPSTVERMAP